MTPCVYHYIPRPMPLIGCLSFKIPIYLGSFIISFSYIKIAMLLNWLETLRLDPVSVPWFISNFNLPSTTLKLMQLPFCPNPFPSVMVKIDFAPMLFFIFSNSLFFALPT